MRRILAVTLVSVLTVALLALPGPAAVAATYSPPPTSFPPLSAVSFVNASTGWVGGGPVSPPGGPAVLEHTTDGGVTFTDQSAALPVGSTNVRGLKFVDASRGWALIALGTAPATAIVHTSDGGKTWSVQTLPAGLGNPYALNQVSFSDALHGIVTGSQGNIGSGLVLHTSDGGLTWAAATPAILGLGQASMSVVDGGHAWILGAAPSGLPTLMFSGDGGVSWRVVSGALFPPSGNLQFIDVNHAWVLSTQCPGIPAVCSDDVYMTSDGGVSWTHQSHLPYYAGDLRFADSQHGFLITNNAGTGLDLSMLATQILSTSDGGVTWQPAVLGTPFPLLYNTHLAVLDTSHVWAVGAGFASLSDGQASLGYVVNTVDGSHWQSATIPPGQISVSLSGTGAGTITSTPAGISCPGTCQATFPVGSAVTLHAAPAADGTSFFAGWGHQCGTSTWQDCALTATVLQTAVYPQFRAVTAVISAAADTSVTGQTTERILFNACSSATSADPAEVWVYAWQVTGQPLTTTTQCDGALPGGYTATLSPGDYPTTLTVANNDRSVLAQVTTTVHVRPFARFQFANETVSDPTQTSVPVDFDACASGGVSRFTWTTAAGTTSTNSCKITIALPVSNASPVSLVATDSTGQFSVTDSALIAVAANTGAPCNTFALGGDACWRQGANWFGNAFSGPTRNPDYVVVSAAAGVGVVGISGSAALTCDGNSYLSASLSVGGLAPPVTAVWAYGYIGSTQGPAPTMAAIDAYVRNEDSSVTAGIGGGLSVTHSNNPGGPSIGAEYWAGGFAGASISASFWSGEPAGNVTPATGAVCARGVTFDPSWQAATNQPVTANTTNAPVASFTSGTTATVLGDVYLNASGFAPGLDVTLTLHSTPLALGVVPADSTGSIGTLVTLPAGTTPGLHTITLSGFAPDGNPRTLSATINVVTATSTAVSADPNPAGVGTPVTFTAAVTTTTGSIPVTAGAISFSDHGVALTNCSNLPLDSTGHATCLSSTLAIGSHQITAAYEPDPIHAGSSSPTLTEVITKLATTTTITTTPSRPTFGTPISFQVTVTTNLGHTSLSGSVSVLVDGQPRSLTLTGGHTVTTILGDLGPGAHTITASYAGNASTDASTGNADITVSCGRVLTGILTGPLHITQPTCLQNATLTGPLTVTGIGTALAIADSTLTGPVRVSGISALRICASQVTGPISAASVTGSVVLGDDGYLGCPANTIMGPVSVIASVASIEITGNTIRGPLQLTDNLTNPTSWDALAPEVEGNTILGPLTCTGNQPAPTDDGRANQVTTQRKDQCSRLTSTTPRL